MAIGYAIDEERRFVFIRLWGDVTDELLMEHAAALRSDPRFEPGHQLLVDLRGASISAVSTDFIRRFRSPFDREARRVLIVDDVAAFGMARMYGFLHASDESIVVVEDPAEAVERLGLPRDYAFPTRLDFAIDPDEERGVADRRA
jgi:hypothetical protein